jgi:hypothetical protein
MNEEYRRTEENIGIEKYFSIYRESDIRFRHS